MSLEAFDVLGGEQDGVGVEGLLHRQHLALHEVAHRLDKEIQLGR